MLEFEDIGPNSGCSLRNHGLRLRDLVSARNVAMKDLTPDRLEFPRFLPVHPFLVAEFLADDLFVASGLVPDVGL